MGPGREDERGHELHHGAEVICLMLILLRSLQTTPHCTHQLKSLDSLQLRMLDDIGAQVTIIVPRRHEHRDMLYNLIAKEWHNVAVFGFLPYDGLSFDALFFSRVSFEACSGDCLTVMNR